MKPKEVLIEAVNKFLKEKLKEKGFVFSDSQLKFTKKLKDGLIGEIGFRAMSYECKPLRYFSVSEQIKHKLFLSIFEKK